MKAILDPRFPFPGSVMNGTTKAMIEKRGKGRQDRGGGRGSRAHPVPKPVAGGRERHGLATKLERVELRDEDPGSRTPGGSETTDEKTGDGVDQVRAKGRLGSEDLQSEGDENVLGGLRVATSDDSGTDDDVAGIHPDSASKSDRRQQERRQGVRKKLTSDEEVAATKSLDQVDTRNGCEE